MKPPIRVQFLADTLEVGGAERVVEALCLHLSRFGIEVGISCFRAPGVVGEDLRRRGLEVVEGVAPAPRSPASLLAVRRHLRRLKPDVVYTLDHSNVLFFGRAAARWAGVPHQLCAIHRTGRADGTPSLGVADRSLMRLSERIVAVSRGHAEYLATREGLDPARLHVIHNGVDPDRFAAPVDGEARDRLRREFGFPVDAPVVAIVAAFRPEKNHSLLFQALARGGASPPAHLAVVGQGLLARELESETERLGLGGRVHWMGLRGDVPRILSCVDALALSSHPVVETFPLCILEAMAARLPVVSTDVGSIDEMVVNEENAYLVPPGDADAFAARLDALWSDPARARGMGEAGRRRLLAHFTQERMVESTAALIREICVSPSRIKG